MESVLKMRSAGTTDMDSTTGVYATQDTSRM